MEGNIYASLEVLLNTAKVSSQRSVTWAGLSFLAVVDMLVAGGGPENAITVDSSSRSVHILSMKRSQ